MTSEVPLHCTKIVRVIEALHVWEAKVQVYHGRDEWALVSKRFGRRWHLGWMREYTYFLTNCTIIWSNFLKPCIDNGVTHKVYCALGLMTVLTHMEFLA